jgi:hypothetical protein
MGLIMSNLELVKNHVKSIMVAESALYKAGLQLLEFENGEVKLIYTFTESDCSDITNIDPDYLAIIMDRINQYINDNKEVFDFQYWEVEYHSEPIPWEDYTDNFADFNIYGIYINKEKSQQHKDLEEQIKRLEETIILHNSKLEELLK